MHLLHSLSLPLLGTSALARAISPNSYHQNVGRSTPYEVKESPLTTSWTDQVGTNPWPEYPRPQLQRPEWQNLNGLWQYQNASGLNAVQSPPTGQDLAHEVLVPSCLEGSLSGIQGTDMFYSWFSTKFDLPSSWNGQRMLLHFGAVDYESTVFINGKKAGFNRGGFFHFEIDITEFINFGAANELLVFVHDPTDKDDYVIPVGKQTLTPAHIFYTPCSGIWQSVWIEPAPLNWITQLDVDANMDGQVNVTAHSARGNGDSVEVTVYDGDENIASHNGSSDQPLVFTVSSPKLWSPDSPTLYNITVRMGDDEVHSYTGFRTISKGTIDGIVRPLLNGEFIFMFGTLDQGYWPDGIFTPPNREAMVYDLEVLKDLGFNMVRKHIKVEPALFYRACDELGLLVIQDMPALRPLQTKKAPNCTDIDIIPDADQQVEFSRQLELLVHQLRSYPSISTWVIYNEGWGQITDYYPEFELNDRVKALDPTRLVDSTSGWFDHGAGDFSVCLNVYFSTPSKTLYTDLDQDNHHYANPQCGTPFYSADSSPFDSSRIGFQGEFGGLGNNVSIDHLWNVEQAVNQISETYEIDATVDAWNYRSHLLLTELKDQVRRFACSGGVWTQTTDVEGEINGLMTYDRRIKRVNENQWKDDIQALYDAAAARGGNAKKA